MIKTIQSNYLKIIIGSVFCASCLFAKQAHAGTTPVTHLGVNNTGGFPVALTTPGETYQLTEDIVCPTTCFTVKASNITVDLNGKTATFGTINNPGMANTDFESWANSSTLNNWTMLSGTVTQRPAVIYGNYDAELSPTASIRSDVVTLKANQTYVYYTVMKGSSNDSYEISVRSAIDDSVLASSSISGNYLGRSFAMTDGSLTAAENVYKPSADVQAYIRIDCVGSATKRLHMADIKPSRHYFLASNNYRNTALYPDLNDSLFGGAPSGVVVKNGSIIQGGGNAVKSAAIYSGAIANLQNLSVVMSGNNTTGASLGSDFIIDTVTFNTSSVVNFNRMHPAATLDFGSARSGRVEIKNSTFLNDPEMALRSYYSYLLDSDTHSTLIYNNTFRHKEYCTEGYAIAMSGVSNVTIENNDINPIRGRGILLDAVANRAGYLDGTKNIIIRNNTIRNIYETANAEYGSEAMEAAGIRIREFAGEANPQEGHRNLQIYGNVINLHVDSAGSHRSYGFNIMANVSVDTIDIYDNTITADILSQATADWSVACIAFQDTDETTGGSVNIHNNICSSDGEGVRFGGNDGAGTNGVNIYRNNVAAKYPFYFYGYPGSPAKPFSNLNIYENSIQNNDTTGYPFYFENVGYSPVVTAVYASNNNITNANAGGYELYTTKDYSNGFITCGNGIFDITGGGLIGTAAVPCHNGTTGGWAAAGLTVADVTPPAAPTGLSVL